MSSEPPPSDQLSGERPSEMPPAEQPAEAPPQPAYEPPSFAGAEPPPGVPPSGPPIEPVPPERPPIAMPPPPPAAEPMPGHAPPPPPPAFAAAGPPPPPTAPMAGATQPSHRLALPSLIMGILSMLGALSCVCLFWIPFVGLCPSVWTLALGGGALYTGNEARREIEASGGTVGGQDQATAGFIMGIIGVVLGLMTICIGLLYAVGVIALPRNPVR